MTAFNASRRRFLAVSGAVGTGALLSSCVTQSPSASGGKSGGPVTLQSNLSSPQAKTSMQQLVAAFNKRGGAEAKLNTVASETFRTQLPTYLTSANPPDMLTWYPGSVARRLRQEGPAARRGDMWAGPRACAATPPP